MTRQGFELAISTIEENGYSDDKVLVVYLPDVHESIAGIIAGGSGKNITGRYSCLQKARMG